MVSNQLVFTYAILYTYKNALYRALDQCPAKPVSLFASGDIEDADL